jgi:hypothetical protein
MTKDHSASVPKLIIILKTLNNFQHILPRCLAAVSCRQNLVKNYADRDSYQYLQIIQTTQVAILFVCYRRSKKMPPKCRATRPPAHHRRPIECNIEPHFNLAECPGPVCRFFPPEILKTNISGLFLLSRTSPILQCANTQMSTFPWMLVRPVTFVVKLLRLS